MAQSVPTAARERARAAGRAGTAAGADDQPTLETGARPTRRWRGITGLSLLAIGLGLLIGEAGFLLAATVGIAAAAGSVLTTVSRPKLAVEREIDDREPAPGARVSVTVTVRNEGDGRLTDLRLVDGVPDGLAVVDGTPRQATALRPGEEAVLSYTVQARRGDHAFEPLAAIVRDAFGTTEHVAAVDTDDRIRCVPPFPATPPAFSPRVQTTRFTGRTTSEDGGTGIEFHATRAYRSGDPRSRIDWRRTARTGDLTTVEYRQERAAAIVLVVDARRGAYVAPDGAGDSGADSAVDRCVAGARAVAAALLDDGHTVGLTAVSPRSCWLAPARGPEHRMALRSELATADAFARRPPSESCNVYGAVRSIRQRLPSDAQVVLCTPAVDDGATDAALRFEAHGHATTVLAPDPTGGDTLGQRTARLERDRRVDACRRGGLRVVDWRWDESLDRALARTSQRWSA